MYTTLNDPSATMGTVARGINATGQIVGYYTNATGTHGFLLSGGTYTTLDDPLATNETVAYGINDAGQIVGQYNDLSGTHSFLYSGGVFTTIDDPVNGHTFASGINNNGQIIGTLSDGTGDHGFLLTISPNPPPPAGTTADMILRGSNTSPAVAGQYEIYDIANNAIATGYSLGQVGTNWQFAGLGGFYGSDTSDMLLRNSARAASRSTTSATTTSPTPPSWATSAWIGGLWASAISAACRAKPT
jgi:probable HAF family extracellular repeat protein